MTDEPARALAERLCLPAPDIGRDFGLIIDQVIAGAAAVHVGRPGDAFGPLATASALLDAAIGRVVRDCKAAGFDVGQDLPLLERQRLAKKARRRRKQTWAGR